MEKNMTHLSSLLDKFTAGAFSSLSPTKRILFKGTLIVGVWAFLIGMIALFFYIASPLGYMFDYGNKYYYLGISSIVMAFLVPLYMKIFPLIFTIVLGLISGKGLSLVRKVSISPKLLLKASITTLIIMSIVRTSSVFLFGYDAIVINEELGEYFYKYHNQLLAVLYMIPMSLFVGRFIVKPLLRKV